VEGRRKRIAHTMARMGANSMLRRSKIFIARIPKNCGRLRRSEISLCDLLYGCCSELPVVHKSAIRWNALRLQLRNLHQPGIRTGETYWQRPCMDRGT
jgi:hypothetical protein